MILYDTFCPICLAQHAGSLKNKDDNPILTCGCGHVWAYSSDYGFSRYMEVHGPYGFWDKNIHLPTEKSRKRIEHRRRMWHEWKSVTGITKDLVAAGVPLSHIEKVCDVGDHTSGFSKGLNPFGPRHLREMCGDKEVWLVFTKLYKHGSPEYNTMRAKIQEVLAEYSFL